MVLLNHLIEEYFGNKKDIAEELVMDADKRMDLWQKHLSIA